MFRLALLFLWLAGAARCLAAYGVVSTLDGRKLEGEIRFARGALVVEQPSSDAITIPATNILLAQFSTNATAPAAKGRGNGLLGVYYNTTNLTGPVVMRLDETIDFDWRGNPPLLGVTKDFFSVRWMGQIEAPTADTYTIHFGTDDGGRIFLDDQLVADDWGRPGPGETSATVKMLAGEKHRLKLEYVEVVEEARAQLWWSTPSLARTIVPRDRLYAASFDSEHEADISGSEGLLATYFNDTAFKSNSFTRVDPEIDFHWKGGPPAPGISSNGCSIRWSGNLLVTNSGDYRFYIVSGAPIRFFINDKLLSNPWLAAQQTMMTTLQAGERCDLRLEVRATNNMNPVRLLWSSAAFPKSVVPRQQLAPSLPSSGVFISRSALPPGVVLLSGAIIGAPILSANESSIRFKGVFAKRPVPLTKVARIQIVPLSPVLAAAIPQGRAGVLLKNRDFIDGDFAGIENGRLKLSSVLFGNRNFDLAKEVVAIVLRGTGPPAWHYSVAARDGTILYGQSVSIEPAQLSVGEAREFAVSATNVFEIARAPSAILGGAR